MFELLSTHIISHYGSLSCLYFFPKVAARVSSRTGVYLLGLRTVLKELEGRG